MSTEPSQQRGVALYKRFLPCFKYSDEMSESWVMAAEDSNASVKANKETIAIIGSGDFGRALAGRMVKAGGYNVVIGSRDSEKNRQVCL